MTIFLSIIFLIVVASTVAYFYRTSNALKTIFWPAIVFKSVAGIGVGILYMFYYKQGDTLAFFSDGVQLAELARADLSSYLYFLWSSDYPGDVFVQLAFGDQRAVFMDKIVSIFCLLGFDNYWLISFYLTLISFLGSWYLVKCVHLEFPHAAPPAVVAFLFFPSIVFWTSGLIKETIAMAGLYFLSGLLMKIWKQRHITIVESALALLAAYLLWTLKYYFAGMFFATAGATLISRFIGTRIKRTQFGAAPFIIWILVLTLLITGVTFLHPNFRIHKLLTVMVWNYEAFVEFSKPEGVISFYNMEPTVTSMLMNSPKALVSGLYRPLFFDAHNLLAFLLSIENLILVSLSVIAIPHTGKLFESGVGILLYAILVYVILLAIFITLSTPNLGTLARYRVGYLPFFVFLLLLAPPVALRLQKLFRFPQT